MYMDFAAAGFCLAVFSGIVWMGSVMVHDVREERQAAYFRRHEKELQLKGQVNAMETTDPLCNPSKSLYAWPHLLSSPCCEPHCGIGHRGNGFGYKMLSPY